MAIPSALLEGGGDKMLPLVFDDTGENKAALWKAIGVHTINAEDFAHVGVATHEDAATWAAGDPVVVIAGYEGTTVRGLLADATGRLIPRPQAVYNNGGSNAFAHPQIIARETLNSEEIGWLAVGSHVESGTFAPSDAVTVIAGIDAAGTTAYGFLVDDTGGVRPGTYGLGGNDHVNIAVSGTAIQLGTNTCRRVKIAADNNNAGAIYIGDSAVTNDEVDATGGYQLDASQQVEFDIANTDLLYINGADTDGIGFIWLT